LFVDAEVKRARLAICRTCEFWNNNHQRCAKCGCVAAVKFSLASSSCPIGKWEAVKP
jgi:hypothetical protein